MNTGAVSQGAGLSFGGDGLAGGETDLKDFCCPEYLNQVLSIIDSSWAKNQTERGATVMKFTIARDGSVRDVSVERSSGVGILDRASRSALVDPNTRLPSLPTEYQRPTLTVHLTFPYGTQ